MGKSSLMLYAASARKSPLSALLIALPDSMRRTEFGA